MTSDMRSHYNNDGMDPDWRPPEQRRAAMNDLEKELIEACKAQHRAIDILFAMLATAKPDFLPSKSGEPWDAAQKGHAVLRKAGVL